MLNTILITGFPSIVARDLCTHLIKNEPSASIVLLTPTLHKDAAHQFVKQQHDPSRITILIGDSSYLNMGLSSDEFQTLTETLTLIHHVHDLAKLESDDIKPDHKPTAAAHELIHLARKSIHLTRICYWSSICVFGKQMGVIDETIHIDDDHGFYTKQEETLSKAEQTVTSNMTTLPITIFRVSNIVGDSTTGLSSSYCGLYYLLAQIVHSPLGINLLNTFIKTHSIPVTPINYILEAGYHLSNHIDATHKIFHLVDPNPLPSKTLIQCIKNDVDVMDVNHDSLTRPRLDTAIRKLHQHHVFQNHFAHYRTANTIELLTHTTIRCPRLESYNAVLLKCFYTQSLAQQASLDSKPLI